MTAIASAAIEPGVVRQQLDRILASSQFSETTRLQRFLRHLVDQSLAGNEEALKGYSIGLDVFDKPDDFDPAIDTIVRVQAGKLRSRLDFYYATQGAEDPLRILVPKGSYIPVFQLALDPETSPSKLPGEAGQNVAVERYSIAVMPFENLSGSKEQEFLADGFTEEILNALTRFREFRVAARHSTFRYKDKRGDAREIGEELGVRYILEGSVRRWEDQVRVTSQLIDAKTGAHMLSETFDDDMSVQSLFEIQETIASQIAAEIAEPHGVIHRTGSARRQAATDNLDAFECRLLASEYWRNPSNETHRKVTKLLERAVQIDPDYAGSWAMLAILYGDEARYSFVRERNRPPLDRALEAAKKAVAADPKDATGLHALFMTHFNRNELSAFRAAAERALALNPNYPDLMADFGACTGFSGGYEEGLSYLDRAISLSPDPPGWYKLNVAIIRYLMKDYQTALETIEGEILGASYLGDLVRAMLHAQLGDVAQAKMHVSHVKERSPHAIGVVAETMSLWNFNSDDIEHFLDGLRKAGLEMPVADE